MPLHEKPYDPYRQAHENKRSHVTFERDGHDSPRNDNRVAKAIIAVGSWVTRGYGSMSTLVPLVRALYRPSHRELIGRHLGASGKIHQ